MNFLDAFFATTHFATTIYATLGILLWLIYGLV